MSAFRTDRKGGVSVLMAGALAMLLAGAALAVDTGSLYLARRQLQGAADAAALAAAAAPADRAGAAGRALAANAIPDARLESVEPGGYVADRATPSARRFVAGAAPSDAARVTLTRDVPLIFGRVVSASASAQVRVRATAARIDFAAFSIGSRLAREDGGLPGTILSSLAGSRVTLSTMDYEALLSSDVDLFAYLDALRLRQGTRAASFDTVLRTQTSLSAAVDAIADASSGAAAAALRTIGATLPPRTILPRNLIDLGPYAARDGGAAKPAVAIDSYALLRETLALSNGARQVAVTPPPVSGLASATASLAIGDRMAQSPWLAVARDGSVVVRTAQTRLYVDAALPGAATLGLVTLRLPIYVELAAAEARLGAIACRAGPAQATVSLDVRPSIGSASVADIDTGTLGDFGVAPVPRRATIARAPLAEVTGSARMGFGGTRWRSVEFTRADIAARTIRTISTDDLARGIASSLVGDVDLRASAAGVGIPLSPLTGAVGAALTPAAPALDALLNRMAALLGLGIGQADVRVDGVRCGRPTLVA